MSHYKDWRPQKLDVESMATDARLSRIEAKLDLLLAKHERLEPCEGHSFSHQFTTESGCCNICGKPVKQYG